MSAPTRTDPSLECVVLVDQLPSDAWAEGLALRPCGHVLATRVDGPELFSIDPSSDTQNPNSTPDPPRTLFTFDDVNCVIGICPLTGTEKEEYAVLSCYSEFAIASFRNVIVWRLSFDSPDEDAVPAVSKIAELQGAGFCLGLIAVSDDTLVIADTSTPCAWRVNIPSGKVSELMKDPATMGTTSEQEMFGMNRLRVAGGYLWYTNTTSGVLYRARVEYTDGGRDIRVAGPPETVTEGLDHTDGLVMTRDGKTAYATSYVLGNVWKIDIDSKTGKGSTTVLMEDLITPTAMDLVYKDPGQKPTLYVVCCGAVNPALLEGDRGVALSLANVDTSKLSIMVTITTDITVTYEPADVAA